VNNAVHGGSRDAVGSRDLSQAAAVPTISGESSPAEIEWTTTDVLAFELGPLHAGNRNAHN